MYVVDLREPDFEEEITENDSHKVGEANQIDRRDSCDSQVTELPSVAKNNSLQKKGSVKCSKWHKATNYFSEFMNNSSIHGFKYLAGNERSLIEKCFWLVILSASTYLCATQVALVYKKWEENPTFIGMSQDPVQPWEIPFPAVTVCPGYRTNKNSTNKWNVILSHVIGYNVTSYLHQKNTTVDDFFCDISGWDPKMDVLKMKLTTSFSEEDIFRLYVFFLLGSNYNLIFAPIFTELGLCFSTNMLDRRELFNNVTYLPDGHGKHPPNSGWNFDERNRKMNKTLSYPFTTISPVYLALNSLRRIGCNGDGTYVLILHHPTEVPTYTSPTVFLDEDKYTMINIKPKVTVSAEGLKSYSPQRRKCFFTFERQLQFYKTYSFVNCRMECIANYTLKVCGCVTYFMPRNATTMVCSTYMPCTYQAAALVSMSEMEMSDNPYFKSCNCLPSCSSVVYNTNVNMINIPKTVEDLIEVEIKIEKQEILSFERNELFGDISFLASCGGLLGLFTGFSFMSLIEIVYYLCFRWIYNLAKSYWRKYIAKAHFFPEFVNN